MNLDVLCHEMKCLQLECKKKEKTILESLSIQDSVLIADKSHSQSFFKNIKSSRHLVYSKLSIVMISVR